MNSAQCQTIFLLKLGSELQIRSSWCDRDIISGTGSAPKHRFVTRTKISGYPKRMLNWNSKSQCETCSAWRNRSTNTRYEVSFLVCLASNTQVGPTEMRRSGRYLIPFSADIVTFVTGMNTELRTSPTASRSVNYHTTSITFHLNWWNWVATAVQRC